MAIVLVGMMGAGKTAVGVCLAQRLGRPFVDADGEIEARAGCSVADLFATRGEQAFRDLEREVVLGLLEGGASVIALGGGAVVSPSIRERLLAEREVVWIEAAPEVLAARTAGADRPLLAGLDAQGRRERLAALLDERAPLYAEVSDRRVAGGDRLPEEVAADIEGALASPRERVVRFGERACRVICEAGGLQRIGERLVEAGARPGPIAVVTCRNVQGLHLEPALASLARADLRPLILTVPPGEAAKALAEVERLSTFLSEAGLDRGSWVLGIGGGAVTDLAGFIAATYRRGIAWAACPTTLLGMVDAAIGGKTGVNLPCGKNLVGAFHQPRLVVQDPRVLATLPAREVRGGLGEVLKHAILRGGDLLPFVEGALERAIDPAFRVTDAQAVLVDLVERSAAVKIDIVAEDEEERTGRRKALNLGHTLGHALEHAKGYGAVSHGEAVVWGMHAAVALSVLKGICPPDEAEAIRAVLDRVPARDLGRGASANALLRAMRHDKKFERGRALFVLLRGRGGAVVDVECSEAEVRAVLAELG